MQKLEEYTVFAREKWKRLESTKEKVKLKEHIKYSMYIDCKDAQFD